MKGISSRSGFWIGLAAVIGFKLWLIQGEEIVGSAGQYDTLWYVRSASRWYWGTPYSWIAFIRPCIYPLWIALAHSLHIPLRLAIELLQIGGALVLVSGLRRLGISRAICVFAFVAISLHPAGYQLDDYSGSDTFYAGVSWIVLGGLLWTMAAGQRWAATLTGVAIGILWNAREEGLLLLAIVLVWSAICLSRLGRAGAKLIILTCLVATLVSAAIYSFNYAVFHSFARSEMNAPAFQSLFHSLLRIKPAQEKRYAPITGDALSQAFAISPTFARLQPELEGAMGENWRIETFRRVGVPNEIGAGWIVWAIRQAANARGYFTTPAKAQEFFKKSAQEINQACDDGRLQTRFVLDGFLDPLVQSGGMRAVPHSAKRIALRFFARWEIKSILDDTILTTPETSLYNEMTRRRSAGVGPRSGPAFAVERFIARYYFVGSIALHLVAVCAVAFLFFLRRKMDSSARFRDVILLLSCAVLLRSCLFTWLDATAFDGTEDRFLFPILPIWMVVLILTAGWSFEAMRRPRVQGAAAS